MKKKEPKVVVTKIWERFLFLGLQLFFLYIFLFGDIDNPVLLDYEGLGEMLGAGLLLLLPPYLYLRKKEASVGQMFLLAIFPLYVFFCPKK